MVLGNNGRMQLVPVDELVLDRSNPRIARLVEIYRGEITDHQMRLAMGAEVETNAGETTYHSLRVSIQTNGGVIHPIIVNECDEGKVVIEGNTRTLIYKEFNERGVAGDWSRILAIIHRDLSQQDIDAVRLQAHLVGPRQWDPYSKAKYLNYLRNSQHLTWDQVVDFCGGQKNQARNYVAAYNDMEEFYRPILASDDQFDPTRFSAFEELQRPRVQQSLVDNGFGKGDFAKWVDQGLIYPLNTVRSLPAILNTPEARKVFLEDGAKAAVRVLDTPEPGEVLKEATLEQLASEINRRVLELSYAELTRLRSDVASYRVELITEARDNLEQLCQDIASD